MWITHTTQIVWLEGQSVNGASPVTYYRSEQVTGESSMALNSEKNLSITEYPLLAFCTTINFKLPRPYLFHIGQVLNSQM